MTHPDILDQRGNTGVKSKEERLEKPGRLWFPIVATSDIMTRPRTERRYLRWPQRPIDPRRELRLRKYPPLESGDRLSRAEFERRYEAMPGLKKAELIEGVVHVPSPVSVDRHGEPQFELIILLGHYKWATPGVRGADNATARLDLANEPQPDVSLFIDPPRGGQARLSSDGFLETAPNSSPKSHPAASATIYTRISKSTAAIACVSTWSWRVRDREIDWFILKRRKYVKLP